MSSESVVDESHQDSEIALSAAPASVLANRVARLVGLVAGVSLVFAGMGKLFDPHPFAIGAVVTIPWLGIMVLGLYEVAFGAYVLFGATSETIWKLLFGTFLFYIVVLLARAAYGAGTCNCIAGWSANLSAMLVTDVLITIGLLVSRDAWCSRIEGVKLAFLGGKLAIVLPVALLVLIGYFGSIPAAFSYISGADIVARSPQKHISDISVGETRVVPFILRNFSDEDVRIVGGDVRFFVETLGGLACQNLGSHSSVFNGSPPSFIA